MSIFSKQEIDFDKFVFFALTQVFKVYDPNKESILDKAQWENSYKMSSEERENLWASFLFLIPTGIYAYAVIYFKSKYENSDISRRIWEAYSYYLQKDKDLNKKELESFSSRAVKFISEFEDLVIVFEERGEEDLIVNTGVAFAEIVCKPKIVDISDSLETQESQINFAALKLAKSYLIKGGVLDKLFKGFKVNFE